MKLRIACFFRNLVGFLLINSSKVGIMHGVDFGDEGKKKINLLYSCLLPPYMHLALPTSEALYLTTKEPP